MITYNWKLSADVLAEYTAEDGTQFQQVLETVHWRVTATDDATDTSTTIYGSQAIPKPTTQEGYIDLSVLLDMTDEEKRTTVLGWVELNDPDFVEGKEQSAIQKLQAKLDEPVRSSVSVL
jgi:hypothetical protein